MTGAYATGTGSVNVETSLDSEEARDQVIDKWQKATMRHLRRAGRKGLTTKEIAARIGTVDKGRVATAMTNLLILEMVQRLRKRRENHYVHVLLEYVGEQEVHPYKPQGITLHTEESIAIAEGMAAFLNDRGSFSKPPGMIPREGDHEVARLLSYLAKRSRKKHGFPRDSPVNAE